VERKLASIRVIDEIRPHTNADSLELAIVGGWQTIVKKGEFKAGDHVVYFEVDSVLPVRPEYEFLRKCCYVKKDWVEGFRLKTIKLRGELSQGLVTRIPGGMISFDGRDVTEALDVVKWDPPVPAQLSGQVKGNFPPFLPKTDQERVQNLVHEVAEAYVNHDLFEVTIKLDGSSFTCYYYDGNVGVCSRNLELKINDENKDNTFVKLFVESGLADYLMSYGRNIAIQGELMGPGIQGNRENLSEPMLFVFDIFNIDEQRYLTPMERHEIFNQLRNEAPEVMKRVSHVPVLEYMTTVSPHTELLMLADGPSLNNPIREGIVYKRVDGRFSFKVISNNFLLNEK
jgi:RNA ligase (TIGR02306 family)